jgi:hypothetical protein
MIEPYIGPHAHLVQDAPHTKDTEVFYRCEQMRAAGWHPKTTWSPATEHVRRACKAASRNTAGTRALCPPVIVVCLPTKHIFALISLITSPVWARTPCGQDSSTKAYQRATYARSIDAASSAAVTLGTYNNACPNTRLGVPSSLQSCTAGLGACSRGHSPHPMPTVTVTCISHEVAIEEDDNKRPTHPNPTRARLPPYFSNTTRPHVQQPLVCTLMPCRAPGCL